MDMYLDPQLHREVHQSGEKTWIFKFKDHRANRWHEWCYVRERKGSDRQEMTSGQRASPMGAIFTAAGGPITFRRLTKSQKPAIGSVGKWRMADDGNSFEFLNWACCFGANLLPRLVWTLDLSYAPHIVFREQHRSMLLMGWYLQFVKTQRQMQDPCRIHDLAAITGKCSIHDLAAISCKCSIHDLAAISLSSRRMAEFRISIISKDLGIVLHERRLPVEDRLEDYHDMATVFEILFIERLQANGMLRMALAQLEYNDCLADDQQSESSESSVEGPEEEDIVIPRELSSVPVTFSGGLKTDETGIHAFIFMRFRYPKTSVHLPAEGLPIRFRSILSTYTWPKQFLSVIAHEYGEQWLINRLKTWKWSMSTAFSGVGDIAFATHEQYYKEYTKCNDLLILENVPEYKEKLERNLMDYRAMANMAYPDLTQYPKNGRPRGELRDGSLMALTTNCSKFFSEEHHRFMEPTELLSAQTLPTTRLQERACLAPKLEIKGVNQNLIPKFAGNSMSTPCVGCVLLAALCGLERI
ncbi:unnamed protein product [Durusdinium trenchii]|uniref:Uncharacterized protein n=1 Tax=Durusdinium trenchii TaxID=1381693 RepID=A0ABP0LCU0_9DINO